MISQVYPQNFFTVDFSSYLVQVEALRSYGQSYSLYWDIKPPGLQIFLLLWSVPFGTSFLSYFFLNALLIAVTLVSTYWIIKRFLPRQLQISACAFVLVTQGVFADYGRNFLSADFIGIAIVVSSTALLLANLSNKSNLVALFGLLYAGSIKEVFVFAPLLYFCLITRNNWRNYLRNFMVVSSLFVSAIISYLLLIGELFEYLEILNFKRIVFAVEPIQFLKNTLLKSLNLAESETQFFVIFLVTVFVVICFIRMGRSLDLLSIETKTILCLNILLYVGLVIQQKSFSGHYLLAVYLPATLAFLLLTGRIVLHFKYSLSLFNSVLIAVLMVGLLSDSPNYHRFISPDRTMQWFQSFETQNVVSRYEVPGEGCMQVAYGWAAGSYYYYSERLPCSRYFLANLLLMSREQQDLFMADLLRNPPVDVVYDPRWADLNTRQFELEIFPWPKVLASCYVQTNTSMFHEKFSNPGKLKECLVAVIKK